MSIDTTYILVPIIMLSFFSVIVIIGRDLRKKLKEDLKKKRECATNTQATIQKVNEFVKVSIFQELQNEHNELVQKVATSDKIYSLVAKDLGQVKSQLLDLEKRFDSELISATVSYGGIATLYGRKHRIYDTPAFMPKIGANKYEPIGDEYKSSGHKNRRLGQQLKLGALQNK